MYNFTLIIPTHNRHNYLKRSIEYFKDLDAIIIYCDSSKIKYEGEVYTNIKYHHMPDKNFAEKILLALENIKTNFVALCADDDFILIDSLYKGITILENNNNFKTVVGKYIAFSESFSGDFYYRYNSPPSDLIFNASENAACFFQNYYQILWAMYDKNILLNSFNLIKKADFKNDNFIELVIGAYACYAGYVKFLNEVWGVRELNVTDHWGAQHDAISNDIKTTRDFENFKTLLNKTTFEGYSKIVIDNYLKKTINYRAVLKQSIHFFIPEKIINFFKKYRSAHTSQPLIVSLNNQEEGQLKKIVEILNHNTR